MSSAKLLLIALVVLGLIAFYVSMAVDFRSKSTRNDLRPARRGAKPRRADNGGEGSGQSTGVRGSSGQLRRRVRALG